ncbi:MULTISPECIES: thioesterase family protein [Pseudonocardia]|uniref:L-carnitine dehydrogenase n=2 Tax=Pseudonocardia TaxID=1847 RepID=A0A1Y2N6T9_PSEAH|nr:MULTISPECIES: thioesterase family protein [Pseudonocardia]OSY43174.1 L-carnitine dehydrogenase [Pseudonocardia autotrophica]TDN71662.1 acyl-CoA thioester hydrolase [Pseudonocardia autotrophica]BBG02349.1 4-hydroxybenzoyl-CoA thioesterase [Pseudonocardia autotrophica]GEC23315.1 4-hydroxybenzoyl-CoA thioesterase [Pseudonocardia saturnea]
MAEPQASRELRGPLVHTDTVRPEWIDYNGHLSEPYYVLVFGDATTALMDRTGMDPAYRAASGCSLYTVEAHVRYLAEIGPGAALTVRTRVLGRDAKRLRLWHELYTGPDGTGPLAATEELMCLHVGPDGTLPFPDAVASALDALTGDDPEPAHAGRAISPVGPAGSERSGKVVRRPPT